MNEIERKIAAQGFFGTLQEFDRTDRKDEKLIREIAEAASQRSVLLSQQDVDLLSDLSGSDFFSIQTIACEIIPLLDVAPSEVMNLVHLLVEKGGEDLAANQPNAAFRKWCASDSKRADEIVSSARASDPLSLRHLVFALESKGDFQEALRSAKASGEERIAGVLALSRMKLTLVEAAQAIEYILGIAETSEAKETAGLIKAALDMAGKHEDLDRAQFAETFNRTTASDCPITVHLMASAVHMHLGQMCPEEVEICLKGILEVNPENRGTIREIDSALRRLWKINPQQAGQVAAKLISRTEGTIGTDELQGFFSATESDDRKNLGTLATSWLLAGNYYVCSTLTSHLSEINRTSPCVDIQPADLPVDAIDQVFLCRKAIGFLFLSPMTAASWIIAVLRGGHAEAASEVADLLFDPLLLNYGGALKDWLGDVSKADAPGTKAIKKAIQQANQLWDGFEAAREVVELEPPASQRALVRFQEAEEAARIQEMAREKSIFAQIVTTQSLLYGDQSSFSMKDGDGNRRSQTVHMAEMSVSSELPKGVIFDPVGTEWLLEQFRHEQRVIA
ncbi:hypothetical protein [Antarcticimicrobium sediminis]|uniref:Uncharacterized protein n=1 Tax=Antarcticimicrobium sediminis TaxID=2546227 RepID=A0A4R5EM49_9RHOB|nr:hypothetical protein [Antarcticimicrobium sediminis]TDE35644.1 hypothetical protein E1B25_16970 [Antarcticimicrobium sediminis]